MTDDLISRQQAIDAVKEALNEYDGDYDCRSRYGVIMDSVENLKKLPSTQPERKTGHWIYRKELSKYNDMWSCSECNEKTTDSIMGKPRHNFCPLCGADMRGETNGRFNQ